MNGSDWAWLVAPYLAGLLVLASHVPLGREVLARGIVFVDLALAQIAGLGVIIAHGLGLAASGWPVEAAAFAAALAGAVLLVYIERHWPGLQEPLIGALFVLAASVTALVSAHDPHGGEHLRDLLVGQILWVGWRELVPAAAATLLALGLWLGLRHRSWAFYFALALCVTVSVQLVGVWLVFASLILPALAVRHAPERRGLALGYGLGAAGYALGLGLSVALDWPAGAVIVVALAGSALLVGRLGPRL